MRIVNDAKTTAGAMVLLLNSLLPFTAVATEPARPPVQQSNILDCNKAPNWLVAEALVSLGLRSETEVRNACVFKLATKHMMLDTVVDRLEQPVRHSLWNWHFCEAKGAAMHCELQGTFALLEPTAAGGAIRVTPVSSVADAAKLFEVIVHAPDQLGDMAVDTQGSMSRKPGIGLELLRRLMTEPVTIERLEYDSRTQFWHAGCEYPSGRVQWILRAPTGDEHRWRIVEAVVGNIPM